MKKIIPFIQIMFTVCLLITIIYVYDLKKILLYIYIIDFRFLVLFILLGFLSIFIACIRFGIILKFFKIEYKFINIIKNIFIGSFINQTPLTVVGGDISRMISLKNEGIRLTNGFITVSIDRLLGMFSLLLLSTLLLYNFSKLLDNNILFNTILLSFTVLSYKFFHS